MTPGRSLWTAPQRGVLISLLAIFWGYLLYRTFTNTTVVPDPQLPEGPRASEVEDRIDPNRADWPVLAALPLIGDRRAQDIVSYREEFRKEHPDKLPFARLEDLMNVRGIGTATIAQLEPFLAFSPPLATGPASNSVESSP